MTYQEVIHRLAEMDVREAERWVKWIEGLTALEIMVLLRELRTLS